MDDSPPQSEKTHETGPYQNDARIMQELWTRVQDSLAAEHFVKSCTQGLLDATPLAQDEEASSLVRTIHGYAESHVGELETLLEQIDRGPSVTRTAFGAGLGTTLGWLERLPRRELPEIVRDVYVVLHYAAAGYHILFTRALLLGRIGAAGLARRHLTDYTQAISTATELLAWSAALELPLEQWHGSRAMRHILGTLEDAWARGRGEIS